MIQKMLNDYLWDSISVRDTAVRKKHEREFLSWDAFGIIKKPRGTGKFSQTLKLEREYSDISISNAGADRNCN